MEKKVPRVQSNLNSSVSKFNSSTVTNNISATSSNQSSYPQQHEFNRNQNRGKQHYYGYNRTRPAAQNHGNRRPATYQQSYEVNRDRREQRVTPNKSASPAERKGKHGESATHLLNFSYAPLPSQEGGKRGADRRSANRQTWRSGGRSKQPIYTKQQFLQAHCQFVVKPPVGNEYVEQLVDTDAMVDWEQIDQVIMCDDQLASCPICLEVPTAAKVTKCAHVYCWPCILHYLSLSERAWAKCPICFDPIEDKDLKSVKVRASPKYSVGDEITLYLMSKERDSLYVRPKSEWRPNNSDHLFSVEDDGIDVKYSKLLKSSAQQIEDILLEERRQLLTLLHQEETQSLEASFVEAALNNITESLEKVERRTGRGAEQEAEEVVTDFVVGAEEVVPMSTIKSAPELKTVSYNDAFDEEPEDSPDVTPRPDGINPVTSGAEMEECGIAALEESVTNPESTAGNETTSPEQSIQRRRNDSSTSSSDSTANEQVAADLVLPPTGTQPSKRGNKRTEVYYFYQAADGQHVYLHSINTRILAAEYGSLEMAPQTLTATILECEENSMTVDLRKRLKYLNHLPLYCPFTVCEISLRPPVVSSAVLSHFTEEINQRKRVRNRRQRAETKQYNRAQAEERKRMGKYPDMGLPLDSERHFPVGAPAMSEFLPLVNPHTTEGTAEAVGTTPYSFSQAMKGSPAGPIASGPAPSWPRVSTGAQYVRSRGPQSAGVVPTTIAAQHESDEESSAPTFKQSFSVDFDEMFNKLSVDKKGEEVAGEDNQNSPARGSKKKKQKGKKQVVLFSTSGARAHL